MIEDKQVYTTAKSAEIERRLKSAAGKLSKTFSKLATRTGRSIEKQRQNISKKIEESTKERGQNVMLEAPAKPEKFKTEFTKVQKNEGLKLPPEKIQLIVTVTLFSLILIVILIGIYIPYSSR